MERNVGGTDRAIRVVFGIIFAILAIVGLGGAVGEVVFGILALIGLFTGFSGVCLIYRAFHVSSAVKH